MSAGDRLYAVARLILRSADLAEDAVQEALVRAWQQLPSLRDPDRFDAWLYRLVVNACADQGRQLRRWSQHVRPLLLEPSIGDDTGAVADREQLELGFSRLKPDSGPRSSCTTTTGSRQPKSGKSSASPRGPPDRDCTTRPKRCVPGSKPTRAAGGRPEQDCVMSTDDTSSIDQPVAGTDGSRAASRPGPRSHLRADAREQAAGGLAQAPGAAGMPRFPALGGAVAVVVAAAWR